MGWQFLNEDMVLFSGFELPSPFYSLVAQLEMKAGAKIDATASHLLHF